jgi:hypothetical protein
MHDASSVQDLGSATSSLSGEDSLALCSISRQPSRSREGGYVEGKSLKGAGLYRFRHSSLPDRQRSAPRSSSGGHSPN